MKANSPLALGLLALYIPVSEAYVSSLPLRRSPAAALAAVPSFSPLEISNPLQPQFADAAARLRGAAVAWAGSLAGTTIAAEDLMLALVSPEAFWLLREWRRQAFGELDLRRDVLDSTQQHIRSRSVQAGSPLRGASVSVRSKGLWSTFHKAVVRHKEVHDVLAVRVVLRDDADVYAALQDIRTYYPSVPGRFKDYVLSPKANGYGALHDTLVLPCGRPFEIQLRTAAMHREAEFGEASHRRYKASPGEVAEHMLKGIIDGRTRWPMQPQTAITLAAKLAEA